MPPQEKAPVMYKIVPTSDRFAIYLNETRIANAKTRTEAEICIERLKAINPLNRQKYDPHFYPYD